MGNIVNKNNSIEAKHSVPLGLYPRCDWDIKTLRKIIIDKKLAPIFKGAEDPTSELMDECPICFLFYPGGLNRTTCCKQHICTECFLQVRKPRDPKAVCPFCNVEGLSVIFIGPKSAEEREQERLEQQKVEDAKKRMRQEEIERDKKRAAELAAKRNSTATTTTTTTSTTQNSDNNINSGSSNMNSAKEEEEIIVMVEDEEKEFKLNNTNTISNTNDNTNSYDSFTELLQDDQFNFNNNNNNNNNTNNYNNSPQAITTTTSSSTATSNSIDIPPSNSSNDGTPKLLLSEAEIKSRGLNPDDPNDLDEIMLLQAIQLSLQDK